MNSIGSFFSPLHDLWWAVFGQTFSSALSMVYHFSQTIPLANAIGSYGLAIIIVTIAIKLLLAPLYTLQIRLTRQAAQKMKEIQPHIDALRDKHKDDPTLLQKETMRLYAESGVNPMESLSGCLPAFIQTPILIALYWVFFGNAQHHTYSDHFLFVSHLDWIPWSHLSLLYLIIPALAVVTTFAQMRMVQPKTPKKAGPEQLLGIVLAQTQFVMLAVVGWFAIVTPAGLGLYWLVGNCFTISQQYFLGGLGSLSLPNFLTKENNLPSSG